MFVYRQYHPHCLKFEISAKNGTEVAIVRQPEFFNFECWRPVDYPLIFGNLFGMFLHFSMLIFICVAYIQSEHFKEKLNLNLVVDDVSDKDENETSSDESSEDDARENTEGKTLQDLNSNLKNGVVNPVFQNDEKLEAPPINAHSVKSWTLNNPPEKTDL